MRLCEIVGLVGYALGGLPGEQLLDRLGIKSSDDTVIRRVKGRRRGAIQPTVRVLSVDDWAWCKKQRYGTMLMDLERSQVIDLLPERSADSFARWLGLHPEVEVIARDRSSFCADGGRQGASSAVQITDRYHLAVGGYGVDLAEVKIGRQGNVARRFRRITHLFLRSLSSTTGPALLMKVLRRSFACN
jgi:transposase